MPSRIVQALFLAGSFLLIGCLDLAHAQSMNASSLGGPVTISARWRFQFGDDPAWASPGFDDSQWPLYPIAGDWASKGGRGQSGYAWHRIRITLPKSGEPLAIAIYPGTANLEVYLDGNLASTIGRMRPQPAWTITRLVYAIPVPMVLNGREVEIAVRDWQSLMSAPLPGAGVLQAAPILGTAGDIQTLVAHQLEQRWLGQLPDVVLSIIGLTVAIFSLGLFILQPQAREYLWAALYLAVDAAAFAWGTWLLTHADIGTILLACVSQFLISLGLFSWLFFTWGFVRARADWLFYTCLAVVLLECAYGYTANLYLVPVALMPVAVSFWVQAVLYLFITVAVFVRLLSLARQGNRNAQLFLFPFFLGNGIRSIGNVLAALAWAGAVDLTRVFIIHHFAWFDVRWDQLSTLLSYFAIGAVLVLRFTRASRQEQRLTTEMESARRVQAQLVPAQLPSLPHCAFDVAYRSASEVGGDFYQVFPRSDGSALILLGDVSGKGLKAAMLGTLIVGAAGALAQEDHGPAEMLERLNRHLCGRTDGGFATCLCALLTPAGTLTLANAGQLSPYHNGCETASEARLPLGIVPEAEYAETILQLAPGDTLTFLSDGVVEARKPDGELFGFERTREISARSADEIAAAAQQFGQEDDITVLRIALAAVPAAV